MNLEEKGYCLILTWQRYMGMIRRDFNRQVKNNIAKFEVMILCLN